MWKGKLVMVKGFFAGGAVGVVLGEAPINKGWWNILMPNGEIITWPESQLEIM